MDVSDNVEANATIIDKDVESFVALVIDVSQSVAESQDLPLLIDEIRGLVSGLSGSERWRAGLRFGHPVRSHGRDFRRLHHRSRIGRYGAAAAGDRPADGQQPDQPPWEPAYSRR